MAAVVLLLVLFLPTPLRIGGKRDFLAASEVVAVGTGGAGLAGGPEAEVEDDVAVAPERSLEDGAEAEAT